MKKQFFTVTEWLSYSVQAALAAERVNTTKKFNAWVLAQAKAEATAFAKRCAKVWARAILKDSTLCSDHTIEWYGSYEALAEKYSKLGQQTLLERNKATKAYYTIENGQYKFFLKTW